MGWMGYLLRPTLRAPYGANKGRFQRKNLVKSLVIHQTGEGVTPNQTLFFEEEKNSLLFLDTCQNFVEHWKSSSFGIRSKS